MVDDRASGAGRMVIAPEVQEAVMAGAPVVALESALITHGLPYPENMQAALSLESIIRGEGATAATVAVLDGQICVGVTSADIHALATQKSAQKVGIRDFASAAIRRVSGGTTVAATMFAAVRSGIRVLATGGIGGVHRENPFDISADLLALGQTPMIVVSAGAKAILDLRATVEILETMSVPVIGYGIDEFPAFYSRTSGLDVCMRLDTARQIAEYWAAHSSLGTKTALLVANPIPPESAIDRAEMEELIQRASEEAHHQGIQGQQLTPFLLDSLARLTNRRAVSANMALLANNARLAARIAIEVAKVQNATESKT